MEKKKQDYENVYDSEFFLPYCFVVCDHDIIRFINTATMIKERI